MCGQHLRSRSPLWKPHMSPLWHQASKWNLKLCTAIYQRVFKCHLPICIGPFLHINVILFLIYVFAVLPKFALETLMRLRREPAPWGQMFQLLSFVVGPWGSPQSVTASVQAAYSQSPPSLLLSSAPAGPLRMCSRSGQGLIRFFAFSPSRW